MAQSARPVIGLNMDMVAASKTQRAHFRLNIGYADAIYAAGGLPVVMPFYGKEADIGRFLDSVDGFVMTGGLDLDPRKSGLPMHTSIVPMPARREDHDRLLVRQIMERRMPLLAVGVGMHQLNAARGGSLYMHLPEEMPRSMPHTDPSCSGPHRHIVNLQAGSRLEEIYGEGELRVNSNHHQAVKDVGTRLRVTATAPDGVIEAIETTDQEWFCIGVQWQPESESASALDRQLFECFLQAAVRNSRASQLGGVDGIK